MFNHLFSPLPIGNRKLKNRICFLAHRTHFAENGRINERLTHYYHRRAKGGCGLIILGELSLRADDRPWGKMIRAYEPGILQAFLKFTGVIHETESLVFAQLCHHGFQSSGIISRQPIYGPSAISDIDFGETAKTMEYEDMSIILESFSRSGILAREGGFDGLEIDMGPESLLRQFLSPISNHRHDEYGGSLENRVRFPLQIIDNMRKAVGDDFPLGIQLCADEMFYGGISGDESQEIAKLMVRSKKIDYINVSVGTYYNLHLVQPSMHTPFGFATEVYRRITDAVDIPVIAGHHIPSLEAAEKLIIDGQANAVGLIRNLICDPSAPSKAEKGNLDSILLCARDNQGCVGRINQSKALSCVQNPTVGFELERGDLEFKPTVVKKRVMVIGAGPAGLEAAKTACLRGHDVTVYEREQAAGGQINLHKKGVGRQAMSIVSSNLCRALDKLKVPIVTGVEVTVQHVLENKPDTVIVATGSKPRNKVLAGEYGPPLVLNVWDVLKETFPVGDTVLFIDRNGGHHATATVELLADQGKRIDLITDELFVGIELAHIGDLYATRQRLLKKGVVFKTDILVDEIRDNTVKGRRLYTNFPVTFEGYDTIVLDMGNVVEDELYKKLKGKVKELFRIGDCVAPRRIDMAIFEGRKVGKAV